MLFQFPGLKHPFYLRLKSTDFQIAKNILLLGEYDVPLPFVPETIIDGGGNIGLAAVVFANKFPNAHILTIEPEEDNYKMILKNTEKYKNITPIQAGIWHKSTFLNITGSELGEWAFVVEETVLPTKTSIRGISRSTLISKYNWNSIDLLKLDIEGSEKKGFENNSNT